LSKSILKLSNKKSVTDAAGVVEKFEFSLSDGEKIESSYRESRGRAEIYLSCQVGCGVGCQFCACSEEWLIRDLNWKEIVVQAEVMLRDKKYQDLNILFNGIGEPSNNERAVAKAVKVLCKAYPAAKIRITTTGANEKAIRKFATLPVSLQLSLHAPTTRLREEIIETVMDIKKIVKEARRFAKSKGQKVTANYLLLKDFNDAFPIIDELLSLLDSKYFRIQLSHLNEVAVRNFPYRDSPKFAVLAEYIASRGYEVTEFDDAGKIANAGCGQLTSSAE
jgi:23S rRNA (adenine2503-C2)-methyltransferase